MAPKISASKGDWMGHPARAALGNYEADSKVVVCALGNKKVDSTLTKESSFAMGHTCGGRLLAGTKKCPLIHTYLLVGEYLPTHTSVGAWGS